MKGKTTKKKKGLWYKQCIKVICASLICFFTKEIYYKKIKKIILDIELAEN